VALNPLLPGIILLVAGIVWIGLFPGVLYSVAEVAAQQVYDPQAYIEAVLGAGRGR
jgi:formate hydrogenlyase subunit 3/multisubunit Na+/H+ antiporter MnhD subunit